MYNDGMTNEQYSSWICSLFSKFDSVLSENGCILWNMSYGSENTECMSLTVADILRKTNFTLADIIVWKKDSAWPNDMSPNKLTRICEFVYVFCRRNEFMTFSANKSVSSRRAGSNQAVYNNVFNFIEAKNNDGGCALNKATFSTDFVKKLLNIYAKPNSFVFDPFMGTGTTAVACHQLGHSFIGSEISSAQCDFAEKRIFDASNQISIFDNVDNVDDSL